MAGLLDNFRRMTGHELRTCPWRGFSDPVCGAVLEALRLIGPDGSAAQLIEAGFPGFVIEGIGVYRSTASSIHASDMDLARKKAMARSAARG